MGVRAQEVITDDKEIVSAIRARLAQRVGADRYEVWFGPTTQLAVRGENLVVSVPNQFFQDWLRSHFRKDLEACSLELFGRPLALEFRIAEMTAAATLALPLVKPMAVVAENAGASESPGEEAIAAHQVKTSAPGVCEFPAGRRRYASLDGFVVGTSNCLAHKAAQMAVERPGVYSPLLVTGGTSTGKTHLLEGIYAAFRRNRPRAAAIYVSAEQFTSSFLDALHKTGMANFRAKHRELELLVIDDLQFLHNKRATIGELVHTIDTLQRNGRQLVFSADRPPQAIKSLGPELISRLSGGMVCRLEPAEYATRLGILRSQAVVLNIEVPDDVLAYMAANFTTQARELLGALKRLQTASLAHRRPITLELAEETLAELIDHHSRPVKLADIERAVCDVFGIGADCLQSAKKGKAVSHPRMLAMYLARKYTRAPLSEIGSYFGRRSHSTVISAQKKIESWMATGATKLSDSSLSIEETIRRVEDQLRAG